MFCDFRTSYRLLQQEFNLVLVRLSQLKNVFVFYDFRTSVRATVQMRHLQQGFHLVISYVISIATQFFCDFRTSVRATVQMRHLRQGLHLGLELEATPGRNPRRAEGIRLDELPKLRSQV